MARIIASYWLRSSDIVVPVVAGICKGQIVDVASEEPSDDEDAKRKVACGLIANVFEHLCELQGSVCDGR